MRVGWASMFSTVALVAIVVGQVLRTDPTVNYLPTAVTALVVLLVTFILAISVRGLHLKLNQAFPWLVGVVSLIGTLIPLWLIHMSQTEMAAALYRGLHVPQGIERFWDAALVLRSIDCSALGVDVFAEHNGCLQDPAIYGPGMLWLKFVPFHIVSFSHIQIIGIAMAIVSSFAIAWIARQSSGIGQMALLIAAFGAPWLLLLERANMDVILIWVAIVAVILVNRRPSLAAWSLVALMIWLIGTWKYYPFVMGLLLIPVLRLRRGWIVLSVWALASLSFVLLTWGNFKFSMQSNSNMTDIADAWVLGRVPVVARMFGSEFPLAGIQFGDVLLGTMALLAAIWGVAAGQRIRISVNADLVGKSMLSISGSSLFLASVLVGGFGWAYKAAFLLLCIPLAARCLASSDRFLIVTGVLVLALTTICSIVVWNTLLASLSGIVAASVAFGVSGFLIILSVTTITSKAKTPPLL